MSSPYAEQAAAYWAAGWRGILPLPERAKKPVPDGYTGGDGAEPSWPDVQAWIDGGVTVGRGHWAAANIGLRLPDGVIGIDVDNYAGKAGLDTLHRLVAEHGELPQTWSTTSRDDGSGIRLFAVPPGLHWPGGLGPGIEVIQHRHRYAVVWPSIHPDTGQTYRWRDGNGAVFEDGQLPRPDSLPPLPAAWVEAITRGELAVDVARADLTDAQTKQWLDGNTGDAPPCHAMTTVLADNLIQLEHNKAARHDIAVSTTQALVHLVAEGHAGGRAALTAFRQAWHAALVKDAGRDADVAGEWSRMLIGAIRVTVASHGPRPDLDPCLNPFRGIAEIPLGLTVQPGTQPVSALGMVGSLNAAMVAAETPLTSDQHSQSAHPAPVSSLAAAMMPGGQDAAAADLPPGIIDPTQMARAMMLATEVDRLRARRQAGRILDAEAATAAFRVPPSTFTLTDELLLPDPPVAYRVEKVLPVDCNVALIAQFKAGKTTLVNHLTRCLVDGDLFLERFHIYRSPGRVGLFNYEVDRGMYRRWLREAGIVNTDAISVLPLRGYRLDLASWHVEDWVVTWLIEHEVTTWVIDPFARAFGGEENSNTEVKVFLETLDVIKERAGVRELILPVHTGREQASEGRERARGATRLDDWRDVAWHLTKDDDGVRYFRSEGRDADHPEVRLGYDQAARRSFVVGGSRKGDRALAFDSAILEALTDTPGVSSTALRGKVREILGACDIIQLRGRVKALEDNGHITVDRSTPTKTKHYAATRPNAFQGIVDEPDLPVDVQQELEGLA